MRLFNSLIDYKAISPYICGRTSALLHPGTLDRVRRANRNSQHDGQWPRTRLGQQLQNGPAV
ncbi:hypothetical protein BCEN4_10011 [Burkholderia cenocepacia]|nr:hypothetical protein BCEN4_10011 [Burkholderia cenocepacia]